MIKAVLCCLRSSKAVTSGTPTGMLSISDVQVVTWDVVHRTAVQDGARPDGSLRLRKQARLLPRASLGGLEATEKTPSASQ
jgi:hypothetical protein